MGDRAETREISLVIKTLRHSTLRFIATLACIAIGALSWLQVEAETVVTGPQQATGPSSTFDKSSPPRSAKLRLDVEATSDEEFITLLLSEMTLDEKIGQLCQIFPGGDALSKDDAKAIASGGVSSIFFTGNEQLVREAQRVAVEESRLGIPLLVARDVIHGFRTIFPIPIGQASSWNPELVRRAAEVAASESRRVGINWTFAPMVDVARDPRWGRIAESCGEDPHLASVMGAAMVTGFQSADADGRLPGIAACPKHFVAYGLAEGGRDYNSVMVSRSALRNVYLSPFKACVDAGALSLMAAFNTVNGVPASGNELLLRDILKREWRFPGLVVSDWGSVSEMVTHGYTADQKQAAVQALRAGIDIEMVTTCYRENLRQLLAENTVQLELIDEAVRRVLLAKLRLNLFHSPYADPDEPALLSEGHRQIARELAQQSVVLLKNDGTLPLQKKELQHVAVIGPFADAGEDQLGCWVLDAKPEDSVTPLAALKEAFGERVRVTHIPCAKTRYGPSPEEFKAAIAAAKGADVVLLFVGEEEALSGEARSRTDLSLPGAQSSLVRWPNWKCL